MKLYYSPGACSLSPHIVLREAGIAFELDRIDNKAKKTQAGADYLAVNPKGQVPALTIDSGETITEGPAIVQYLADLKADSGLAPAAGTIERVRLQETLNFLGTELHKSFGPMFNPASSDEMKKAARETVEKKLTYLEGVFGDGRDYALGKSFTVADAYLFTLLNWTGFVGIDLKAWPKLAAFQGRIAQRPAVQEALVAEGLVKKAA